MPHADEGLAFGGVSGVAVADERGAGVGHAEQHAFAAERVSQDLEVAEAVLERHDQGVLSD